MPHTELHLLFTPQYASIKLAMRISTYHLFVEHWQVSNLLSDCFSLVDFEVHQEHNYLQLEPKVTFAANLFFKYMVYIYLQSYVTFLIICGNLDMTIDTFRIYSVSQSFTNP